MYLPLTLLPFQTKVGFVLAMKGQNVATLQVVYHDRYVLVEIIDKGTTESVLSLEVSSLQRALISQVPLYY